MILAGRDKTACVRGNANEKDAMSMRRFIGISLAHLVTSACAIEETPEEGTSHSPGDSTGFPWANGETPNDQSPLCAEGLLTNVSSTENSSEQAERRLSSVKPAPTLAAAFQTRIVARYARLE